MKDSPSPDTTENAARSNGERRPVSIHFAEPFISTLFSELLKARGVATCIVESVEAAAEGSPIITEPQFFPRIPCERRSECLIVGNKDTLRGLDAHLLSRPLTEEKVEAALAEFLSHK